MWTSIGDYSFEAWQNLAGVGLLVPVFVLLWKRLSLRFAFGLFGIYFLTLFPLLWRVTQRPGTDSYGYFLCFLVYGGVGLAVSTMRSRRWILASGMALLLVLSIWFARDRASVWRSNVDIFRQAYEAEPGYSNQYNYAIALLNAGETRTSWFVTEDLYERFVRTRNTYSLLARVIYQIPEFDDRRKMELFIKYGLETRNALILRAFLSDRLGDPVSAYRDLSRAIHEGGMLIGEGIRCDALMELFGRVCEGAGEPKCAELRSELLMKCPRIN
jgi:hypothetical protein